MHNPAAIKIATFFFWLRGRLKARTTGACLSYLCHLTCTMASQDAVQRHIVDRVQVPAPVKAWAAVVLSAALGFLASFWVLVVRSLPSLYLACPFSSTNAVILEYL